MKALKTYLTEGFFSNVGGDIKVLIRQWIEEHVCMGINQNFSSLYRINDKLEIEPIDDEGTFIHFIKPFEDGQLPDYIRFSKKYKYKINASQCGLTTLKGFPEQIHYLDASKNDIRSLKDITIKKCRKLILDHNKLTSFEGFPQVSYAISVEGNQINNFDDFPILKSLESLNIRQTGIRRFNNIKFTNCKINYIFVDHNNIPDSVHDEPLEGLQFIKKGIYMDIFKMCDADKRLVQYFISDKGNTTAKVVFGESRLRQWSDADPAVRKRL